MALCSRWRSQNGAAGVLVDALDVFRCGEPEAFIGLRHQVADKHADSAGPGDGLWNSTDQQIGDEGCVERAGADGDEIGAFDGFQCFRNGGGAGWI